MKTRSIAIGGASLALGFLVTATLTAAPAPDEPWRRNAPITGAYDKALAVKCENGTFVGRLRGKLVEHLGIPYAVQPVGSLRWTAPQLAPADGGVYEAYDYGPRALQGSPKIGGNARVPMGEDCLVLNVYRRVDSPKGPLPVMVWIHGGAWISGSGSDDPYDGRRFLGDVSDVILVTINYRLGALGYLPCLDRSEKYRCSGNLGLLDAACACKWVKRNIAAFGGDPGNITAFGESAGAGQTALLPFALEEGCVKKFIVQSGSINMAMPPEYGSETTREFLSAAGAGNADDLLSLSTEQIRKAMAGIRLNAFPTADGVVIPKDVWKAYPAKMRGCRLMIGSNDRENNLLSTMRGGFRKAEDIATRDVMSFVAGNRFSTADWKCVRKYFSSEFRPAFTLGEKMMLFVGDVFFREGVIRQAETASAADIPTFVYLMTQPMAGHPDVGCCHATDVGYVFENPSAAFGRPPFLYRERPTEVDSKYDPALSREMRRMWVNFAKSGNPSTPSHVWKLYDSERRPTMLIGPKTGMADDPDGDIRELLSPMLKYSIGTTLTHGGLVDAWHVSDDCLDHIPPKSEKPQ